MGWSFQSQYDIYFLLLSYKTLLYFSSLISTVIYSHPTFLLDECLQSSHPCLTVRTGHGHQIQRQVLPSLQIDDRETSLLWEGGCETRGLETVCGATPTHFLDLLDCDSGLVPSLVAGVPGESEKVAVQFVDARVDLGLADLL
jgi:hypothetical protein